MISCKDEFSQLAQVASSTRRIRALGSCTFWVRQCLGSELPERTFPPVKGLKRFDRLLVDLALHVQVLADETILVSISKLGQHRFRPGVEVRIDHSRRVLLLAPLALALQQLP